VTLYTKKKQVQKSTKHDVILTNAFYTEKITDFFNKFEGTEKDVTRGFGELDLNEEGEEGGGAAPEGFMRMKYGKQLVSTLCASLGWAGAEQGFGQQRIANRQQSTLMIELEDLLEV
jgi:hypothetical protein